MRNGALYSTGLESRRQVTQNHLRFLGQLPVRRTPIGKNGRPLRNLDAANGIENTLACHRLLNLPKQSRRIGKKDAELLATQADSSTIVVRDHEEAFVIRECRTTIRRMTQGNREFHSTPFLHTALVCAVVYDSSVAENT